MIFETQNKMRVFWVQNFTYFSGLALGLSHSSVEWIPVLSTHGQVALVWSLPSPLPNAKGKERISLLTLWVFMACSMVNFTLLIICFV